MEPIVSITAKKTSAIDAKSSFNSRFKEIPYRLYMGGGGPRNRPKLKYSCRPIWTAPLHYKNDQSGHKDLKKRFERKPVQLTPK